MSGTNVSLINEIVPSFFSDPLIIDISILPASYNPIIVMYGPEESNLYIILCCTGCQCVSNCYSRVLPHDCLISVHGSCGDMDGVQWAMIQPKKHGVRFPPLILVGLALPQKVYNLGIFLDSQLLLEEQVSAVDNMDLHIFSLNTSCSNSWIGKRCHLCPCRLLFRLVQCALYGVALEENL